MDYCNIIWTAILSGHSNYERAFGTQESLEASGSSAPVVCYQPRTSAHDMHVILFSYHFSYT